MSSLGRALGVSSVYNPLPDFTSAEIKKSRNVILFVIDGLGYDYIRSQGKDTFFAQHMRRSVTTVFPSTTAAAVTTFATGLAPQQHALVGWHLYLRELGAAGLILPFVPRYRGQGFVAAGIDPQAIYGLEGLDRKISVPAYLVSDRKLIREVGYNSTVFSHSKKLGYETLAGFFLQVARAVRHSESRKYIHAYWPWFDTYAHFHGVGSVQVKKHFRQLEAGFQALFRMLHGTDTTFIITADHGLLDVPVKNIMRVSKHPLLRQYLSVPLTGDARIPYCYVRSSRLAEFRAYYKKHLASVWRLHAGEELINKNYYGLFKAHAKLFDRVGDFVLLTEKPYAFKEFVLGEKEHTMVGHHGGLTPQEMLVPLVVAHT